MEYRSVFISDAHLGSRWSKVEELASFLSSIICERLYLVGDILDGWKFKHDALKSRSAYYILQLLLKLSEKMEIIYIPGNHDDFLDQYEGTTLGGIHIRREVVHIAADGRKYLVVHGDEYDGVSSHTHWLARAGNVAYEATLWFNEGISGLFSFAGKRPRWSFSRCLKRGVKSIVKRMSGYENKVLRAAELRGLDGIICGHIHYPAMRRIKDILYCNTGDWLESCSAVVEDRSGALRSFYWRPFFTPVQQALDLPKITSLFPLSEIPLPFLSCKS
ncbi:MULTISPECIES: UDP-2,3-diacylglucosamine diphosphatase [Aminobacterium]|jgi:UDP-2,3-diacylglucosamine pyrophosphatase LpxH|uniref:UDP-2,3-diacylglucosamine diphosphatase n=1 Tax=Aminobacterium TaxID=81466 RepID=UPI00257F732E|nr:UDP-2,3-diacylglucosamine diphosphatase [Aminobacterium sp. UBA4834]